MQRIRLHQHALQLDGLQQLAQRLDFAAGIGGAERSKRYKDLQRIAATMSDHDAGKL